MVDRRACDASNLRPSILYNVLDSFLHGDTWKTAFENKLAIWDKGDRPIGGMEKHVPRCKDEGVDFGDV